MIQQIAVNDIISIVGAYISAKNKLLQFSLFIFNDNALSIEVKYARIK